MNTVACEFEKRVIEASKRERWTPELTAHVAQCEDCGEAALVSGLLRATEAPRDFEVDLSQASQIWRRADLERRQEQAEKALLPVAIGEAVACGLGGLALGGFAVRSVASSAQSLEAMGQRLFADPLLVMLGATAALLLIGSGVLSFCLLLGFGPAKS